MKKGAGVIKYRLNRSLSQDFKNIDGNKKASPVEDAFFIEIKGSVLVEHIPDSEHNLEYIRNSKRFGP
jgi:hypothetical protein